MNDQENSPPDASDSAHPSHRKIRSYVLRQGRLTAGQQRAIDTFWDKYGLDCQFSERDFAKAFGRHAALVLEIGFGNGEALHHAAMHDPLRDYIGIEVHRPGVGRLLHELVSDGIHNVRVYNHDAVEVLRDEIAEQSLSQIRIYFPDPWHKKKHNKRRLIQEEFVALAVSRLQIGGLLHLATDWENYAEQMSQVLQACPQLENTAKTEFVARPDWRIQTHFEKRGARLGHGVWDLLYRRKA